MLQIRGSLIPKVTPPLAISPPTPGWPQHSQCPSSSTCWFEPPPPLSTSFRNPNVHRLTTPTSTRMLLALPNACPSHKHKNTHTQTDTHTHTHTRARAPQLSTTEANWLFESNSPDVSQLCFHFWMLFKIEESLLSLVWFCVHIINCFFRLFCCNCRRFWNVPDISH